MSTIIPKVNFNNFNGAAFNKIKNGRREAFPIRVIDVNATIGNDGGVVFQKPNSWEFHVISHRWNMYIENLCSTVKQKVEARMQNLAPPQRGKNEGPYGMPRGCGVEGQRSESYDVVLKEARLHECKGYQGLIEFLEILKEDGVELVWFDTLCINQLDADEKASEIMHMGEFYSLSLGCYVALHGLGTGFRAVNENGQPPAWFSRAWTLQEFLIPSKLTFVVEMEKPQLDRIVNFVRKTHLEKKCACKGSSGWAWGTRDDNVSADDEQEFWCTLKHTDYKCTRGRFDRAGAKTTTGKTMYFVGRNAYIPIAYIISGESREIWDFGVRLGLVCQGETVGLVNEISDRDCKVEEDRALCMLALLGVSVTGDGAGDGGMKQLRVGRTLDEQLVELAKGMASCNVEDLVKLCAVAVVPSLTMTWMPTFSKRQYGNEVLRYIADKSEGVSNMKEFKGKVEDVSVSDTGCLSLTCHFMSGRLLPFEEHAKSCTHVTNRRNGKGCASCCCLNTTHENCFRACDGDWVLEMNHGHALPFHSSDKLDEFQGRAFWPHLMGTGNMNYVYPKYYLRGGLLVATQDMASSSNLSLLLLGNSVEKRTMDEKEVLLFMVCLGEIPHKLHKIGQVRVLPEYGEMKVSSKIKYDLLPKVRCTIW